MFIVCYPIVNEECRLSLLGNEGCLSNPGALWWAIHCKIHEGLAGMATGDCGRVFVAVDSLVGSGVVDNVLPSSGGWNCGLWSQYVSGWYIDCWFRSGQFLYESMVLEGDTTGTMHTDFVLSIWQDLNNKASF